MKNEREITYTSRVICYPDGSQDVQICTSPIFRESGWETVESSKNAVNPRQKGKKSDGVDKKRSASRARSKMRRLALNNDFRYFCTLTLDPSKIDRYDPAAVVRKLNQWTDNMVRRHGLRYILVPELHKDGAYHFHGFLAGEGLKVVDSGVEWDGRPVYNLPQWTLGFSTCQELYGDYHKAVGYCCKYIGKQEYQRPLGRWYYSGGGLAEPEYLLCDLDPADFRPDWEIEFPGAKLYGKHIKKEEK